MACILPKCVTIPSFFLLLFPNNNKFCPFSGLKGPVIHMRSNSNCGFMQAEDLAYSL